MAFYDSVKENIRDENTPDEEDDDAEDTMAFDQLKDQAEDREDPDESSANSDSDIEVLGEGDLSTDERQDEGREPERSSPIEQSSGESGRTVQESEDDVVAALERIEEQNREMLDVLRDIKRSL